MSPAAIGITQRALPLTEHGEQRDALDRRWFGFLEACNLVPVPLPNDSAAALRTANRLDLQGLVLSGGDNLVAYGGPRSGRDETEFALVDWALARHLPVLGVCRGAQLLLVKYGARLEPVDGHIASTHPLMGDSIAEVTCYHRYAAIVGRVPPPLQVTAHFGDVVEGFSVRDTPATGIMWHPEHIDPYPPADIDRFRRIFGST